MFFFSVSSQAESGEAGHRCHRCIFPLLVGFFPIIFIPFLFPSIYIPSLFLVFPHIDSLLWWYHSLDRSPHQILMYYAIFFTEAKVNCREFTNQPVHKSFQIIFLMRIQTLKEQWQWKCKAPPSCLSLKIELSGIVPQKTYYTSTIRKGVK